MSVFFSQQLVFGLMGGLGLFLFGMKIMSEGLQKVAGERIRQILSALTNNRFVGTLVGLAVTAIIQSSSATSVMIVGFVNAGLMTLVQSIGVILGANIGTTVTAQLIAFNVTQYALPAIGVGAALKLFSKKKQHVYFGEIILGFGILFFGLAIMKQAFDPLKVSDEFRRMFLLVGDYKLLGVLIGALLTIIVQSSSATIGLTLALASSGLLTFDASVALILGENIGTTVTANIAAIGTSLAARRTAFCHFLFNFIGVLYMLLLFKFFTSLVDFVTPGDPNLIVATAADAEIYGVALGDAPNIARHIANTHTLFNLLNALVFLPLIGILARLASIVLPGREEQAGELKVKYIDSRVLNTPPIALGQARSETRRMARVTLEMLEKTIRLMQNYKLKRIAGLEKQEELVDLLQREITDFLAALSQKPVTPETSVDIAAMMNMVNDLERIGDHCENLWQLTRRKVESRVNFTETGTIELAEMAEKTLEFFRFVVNAMDARDRTIGDRAGEYEDAIDEMENRLRNNHIARLNTGECAVRPGLIYIDLLHNLEKIGDHSYKLSESIIGAK
ncbi:MAG: Na/Pi cotransporter family protein [Desulfuromonadales bacterium]|nr:Na/Pi cotransporter family protein [Desulfuromonadales bacterium]